MTSLPQLAACVAAIALAASLAGCDNANGPVATAAPVPQGTVVANDCRSPNAQSAQRGCRPTSRVMGSL